MLKKIKIEGLFNKFKYDIELKEEGHHDFDRSEWIR